MKKKETVEPKICICASVKGDTAFILSSVIKDCDGCKEKIWVSRSTLELHMREPMFLMCRDCIAKMPGPREYQDLKPNQIAEIIKTLKVSGGL